MLHDKNSFIATLSPHLFWDVNQANIDAEKHKAFLIERVLMYGVMDDWRLLLKNMGIDEILNTAKGLRYLDDVSLHFMANITDTPLTEFRCYTGRQSLQGHWSY